MSELWQLIKSAPHSHLGSQMQIEISIHMGVLREYEILHGARITTAVCGVGRVLLRGLQPLCGGGGRFSLSLVRAARVRLI